MINIEKIEKQIEELKACVDDYKGAMIYRDDVDRSPFSTVKDNINANNMLDRTENTLKTQLRIMADDNREEVKL